jgi:hypothetical protein
MPDDTTPTACETLASRLREVAQLRKLWRALRDPQERRAGEILSRFIVASDLSAACVQEPTAAYGCGAIRAAIRRWWCQGDYTAIVTLGVQLDPALLDEDPLVRVYVEAAKPRVSA